MFHLVKSVCLNLAVTLAASAFVSPAFADEIKMKAEALGFQPHKALYDIKLVGTTSGSQILNISGQMFYEWKAECDAWVSDHRFNILYEYADSAPMRITSDFSTYEPFDGKSLSFTSQRKRDGRLFEEIRGLAEIENGQMGEALYTIPTELDFELPAGTLFPIAHSRSVAEKIREGKKFYQATIFDGSDEDGPVEVSSFIGKAVNPDSSFADNEAIDTELLKSPAHHVRLAFFPLNDGESASDYEMTLAFHENSVISDMVIEYDNFSISQKLMALEPMEDGCTGGRFNE